MGREEIKKKKHGGKIWNRWNRKHVTMERSSRHSTSVASRQREISRNGGAMIRVIRIVAGKKGRKKKKNFQIARFPVFPIKTKRISVDYTRDSYSSVSFRKRGEEGEGEFATVKLSERLIAGTTIGHCACDEASEIRFNANVFVSSVFNQSPILIFEIANPFPPSRQIDRSLSYPIKKL